MIEFKGVSCHVQDFTYRSGQLGLKLIDSESREPVEVVTVSNEKCCPGEVAIPDENTADLLYHKGYISKMKRVVKHGFETVRIYKYRKSYNEI